MRINLSDMLAHIKSGRPGSRFRAYHDRMRSHSDAPTIQRIATTALGSVLIVTGIVLSLPPGMPGFLLWLPGMMLVSVHVRWVAVAIDRMELSMRRLINRLR